MSSSSRPPQQLSNSCGMMMVRCCQLIVPLPWARGAVKRQASDLFVTHSVSSSYFGLLLVGQSKIVSEARCFQDSG